METIALLAQKAAKDLSPGSKARSHVPKKDFAEPNKHPKGDKGTKGKYPMPDKAHERAALGFAAMHHGKNSAEYRAVAAKAHAKFGGDLIAALAVQAAERPYVAKLAEDCGLGEEAIRTLADFAGIPTVAFVKQAYEDPEAFGQLAGLVLTKEGGGLLDRALGLGRSALHHTGNAYEAVGQQMMRPFGGTSRNKAISLALGAGGTAGVGLHQLFGGGGEPSPTPAEGVGGAAEATMPTAPHSGSPGPGAAAMGGGMNPKLKALLMAGGIGAGAYGLSRLFSRKKKEGSDRRLSSHPVVRLLQRAVFTKMARILEKVARDRFTRYLDIVANKIPGVEKRAQVRLLQAQVSTGTPLSVALKLAYPTLSGEQRGVFASHLCKAASDYFTTKRASHRKRANSMMGYGSSGNGAAGQGGAAAATMGAGMGGGNAGGLNTTSPISATGPASAASSMMGQVGP